MLAAECKALMANLVEPKFKPKDLSMIPLVAKFPSVFRDELLWLPPKQAVEFAIDVAPGTRPIFKAPYLVAPAELKNLKSQLEELS